MVSSFLWSLETPLRADANPVRVAFLRPCTEKYGVSSAIQAGSGLIEYPSGEYARRLATVSSSRPFPF
jgi:hypothetical protein